MNELTATMPTAPALRAARVDIANLIGGMRKIGLQVADPPPGMVILSAQIIDRETGLPELMALARCVAEHFEDTDAPLGVLARAAIAKAEGR